MIWGAEENSEMNLFVPRNSLSKFFSQKGLCKKNFPGGSPSKNFPGEGPPNFFSSISSTPPQIINGRPVMAGTQCPLFVRDMSDPLDYRKNFLITGHSGFMTYGDLFHRFHF